MSDTAPVGLRLVVCGGRDFAHWGVVWAVLARIEHERGPIAAIIQGGAGGADAHARTWAMDRGLELTTYKADWKRYGRAAGPIRNGVMLAESKPDFVIAFKGGPGTADCVQQAEAAGIKVWRFFWP